MLCVVMWWFVCGVCVDVWCVLHGVGVLLRVGAWCCVLLFARGCGGVLWCV